MSALEPLDRRDDPGFSLVELAVYVAVLGLIATIVATVMVSLFRSEQTVSVITNVSSNAQNFTTVFDRDARNARSVVPATTGTHSLITLQTADPSAGTPCYRDVVYAVQDGRITRDGRALFDFEVTGGGFTIDGRTVGYDLAVRGAGSSIQAVEASAVLGPANTGGATCAS